MIYINWIYKGTVVLSEGFAVADNEENRKQIERDIIDRNVLIPENYERYIIADNNMIGDWVG